ncbi:hypothetical protein Q4E93_30350 [Flavitalea sp. BT771]|uniref:hypothetical protein n=1 Tax=Flavitalea sp. BT771 TaxID=3063329 RepID=UPI0026E16455|nr:hypothetical protein [Flavitalea sp. BT771]MDO6434954.1 hypothetical protein [Flavitalea sp. BT771]MDV6223854.1 hypothetical protein [Flavitalea sp. BT771]
MKLFNYHISMAVAVVLLGACHKEETVHVSARKEYISQPITSDTLTGAIKGTLLGGKTYYFSRDIIINEGDTVLMQEGARLIAIGDGKTAETSPQVTCNGTFISLGTAGHNNFITVPEELRTTANIGKGFWGGIQCGATSGDVILKWTHIEFAGGPAGAAPDLSVFKPKDPRNCLSYTNINGNFIMEDCWVYGTKDDGMRILHGHVSVMRNTFEACGLSGGEAFNLKNGCLGDVAYNLVIGAATNGFKVSNSGDGPVQTKIYLYNNTILNCGFRQQKTGRGGSINYEKNAQGKIYNNMIINCKYGLRLTPDADMINTAYNHQFFYANDPRLISEFYASDGKGVAQGADVRSATPKANNPLFATYDVNQFDYMTAGTLTLDISQMPIGIINAQAYDLSLLPGSPALLKGDADAFKAQRTVPQGGAYGASTLNPNTDMGAYPTNGPGNLHKVSSISVKWN